MIQPPRERRRVLIVFGTRPEAIKMALLSRALQKDPQFDAEICVTAQHRSMLDQVLSVFELEPRFDLDLMQENQTLTEMTSRLLMQVSRVIQEFRPDWIVVQGDTTTAFVASLAAFYEKVSIAHVEAGLRTGRKYSPWPEEMNRQMISRLADLHLTPTVGAQRALLAEGVSADRIFVTGNTVVDSLLWVSRKVDTDHDESARLEAKFPFVRSGRRLILVTGHRRENFGSRFEEMCRALLDIVAARDVEVVYPVHLNPNVRGPVNAILGGAPATLRHRIHLIDPVEYVPFVFLMKRCTFIITDSGGVQEEAPSLGKPCLVTRSDTERPEAVEAGTSMLVGTERSDITTQALRLLDDDEHFQSMSREYNPYGDGNAVSRIVKALREFGCP